MYRERYTHICNIYIYIHKPIYIYTHNTHIYIYIYIYICIEREREIQSISEYRSCMSGIRLPVRLWDHEPQGHLAHEEGAFLSIGVVCLGVFHLLCDCFSITMIITSALLFLFSGEGAFDATTAMQ